MVLIRGKLTTNDITIIFIFLKYINRKKMAIKKAAIPDLPEVNTLVPIVKNIITTLHL